MLRRPVETAPHIAHNGLLEARADGRGSAVRCRGSADYGDERQAVLRSELQRLRGEVLNAIGDGAAAEQNYHQALATAKRQSAKTLELRAAASLARLWRDQGKRDEARELLAPVYGWFTEGFDTRALKEG